MEESRSKPARKPAGSATKKAEGTNEVESMLSAIGMHVSSADVQELAGYIRMGREKPREVLRYLPEIARFLTRTVPDSALARERIARSLEGIEYLVRAARTVIASEDPDLIRGFQRLLDMAFSNLAPQHGRTRPPWRR